MKIKNLRWYIIILVTVGTMTNYLARSTLGVAAPEMMKTRGLFSEHYSWIVSVFPFTCAITKHPKTTMTTLASSGSPSSPD